jgi:hypothetical protein
MLAQQRLNETQALHTKAIQTEFNTQATHTHTLELVIVYGTNSLKKKEEEDE